MTSLLITLHNQLPAHAFFCALPHWGLIKVTGAKAADFLQGQVSCDIKALDDTNSSLGVHCNPKGRILVSFRIFRRGEDYYLFLPLTMIASTCQILKKYAQFFKVELIDLSETWRCVGLIGEPSLPSAIDGNLTSISISGPTPRFVLFSEKNNLDSILTTLKTQAELVEPEHWDQLDIAAGIPTILPSTQELFTPHQINYQLIDGICFTKGCYTGQEIIARMQYLGKLKQHMYRVAVTATTLPQPGEAILLAGQEVGQIVNICTVDDYHYEALAVLKDEVSSSPDLVLAQSQGRFSALLNLPYEWLNKVV